MTDQEPKLSECCGKEDPEFGVCFLPKGHIGSHQYSPCTIASKPDASSDRLLTREEWSKVTGISVDADYMFNAAVKELEAQDAKTYPLAFEAGRKAQELKDAYKDYEDMDISVQLIEAKKQGERELAKWSVEECPHNREIKRFCFKCWKAKLKSLEER